MERPSTCTYFYTLKGWSMWMNKCLPSFIYKDGGYYGCFLLHHMSNRTNCSRASWLRPLYLTTCSSQQEWTASKYRSHHSSQSTLHFSGVTALNILPSIKRRKVKKCFCQCRLAKYLMNRYGIQWNVQKEVTGCTCTTDEVSSSEDGCHHYSKSAYKNKYNTVNFTHKELKLGQIHFRGNSLGFWMRSCIMLLSKLDQNGYSYYFSAWDNIGLKMRGGERHIFLQGILAL